MAKKNASDFIDFNALIKTYLSKWYWFVISVIFCVGLGYLYTRKYQRPMAVRANVLIQQEDSNPMADLGGMGSLFGSKGFVEDEVFVIGSHSLFKNVAKELGINRLHYVSDGFLKSHLAFPEFPVDVVAPAISDTLMSTIIFDVKINDKGRADIKAKVNRDVIAKVKDVALPTELHTIYGDFTVVTTPAYVKGEKLKTKIAFSGYDVAAEEMDKDVMAYRGSKKSNVISLGLNTPNAEYGVAILNKIIEKYNERGINEKNLQGEKTAAFLEDRIDLLSGELNESELAIQKYKEQNRIVDVAAEASYQSSKKGQMESAIFNIEKEIELLKLTREFLVDSINYNALIPTTVANGGVQSGINSYNTLVFKHLELSQNAHSNSYALRQLTKQMDLLRNNILASSHKALENAELNLRQIKSEQNTIAGKLGNIPSQEREYINMKRQQEIKQEIYLFLLQKQEENAMVLANSIPKGQIIDEAFSLSEPLGVSKKIILVIAFILGLLLPPVVMYVRSLVRSKFDTKEDVQKHVSAPILGEMCIDRSGRSLVVSATDTSSATELFRLIRTNLQFMLGGENDKVVLMTSTRSGEGKSFISLNLAATLSLLEGKRVLLVGMDIRNPQLANYLGINPPLGLTNYLSVSNVTLESIIVPMPGVADCDVIVAGPIPPNPAELLASKKVDELFAKLRTMYDYIIIDSAPVGMVSDTFSLDRVADATVYVTRVNYSTVSDLRYVENIYENNRLKKLSVVVNGTASKKGYGYGYSAKPSRK
ncbi:MAG: polysaccharide biosynthesis tyrosine autokinase [Duncaniella sp.]|uniref:GumC family protein n=1 Tax=Duncaniella sp. TaxID=2518496 RepID=UPI0023C114DF|nr:tyrosine-protein kinase [Duncaniella sp.]MDE6089710.1 polysaccharide biosynthesis tyrosine autokinase [Duncaniella sp.]